MYIVYVFCIHVHIYVCGLIMYMYIDDICNLFLYILYTCICMWFMNMLVVFVQSESVYGLSTGNFMCFKYLSIYSI